MAGDDDRRDNGGWPLPFRVADRIPLPRLARRDPRALVRALLDEVTRGQGLAAVPALSTLGEAVRALEGGDPTGALLAANRAAAEDPSVRPLALLVARMCVRREIEDHRATLVG